MKTLSLMLFIIIVVYAGFRIMDSDNIDEEYEPPVTEHCLRGTLYYQNNYTYEIFVARNSEGSFIKCR